MSQLSVLFHKEKGEIFRSTIQHLETVDLPKDAKAAIAVAVMKVIHVGVGNPWSPEIQAGVVSAIDFVLGEIRGWAQGEDTGSTSSPPNTPNPVGGPVGGSIYGTEQGGTLPTDATLITMGYKVGDVKWTVNGKSAWLVTPQGATFDTTYATMVGLIGH